MRIDILPNNTLSALNLGSTRSENEHPPDGGTFSAVIGQMTAPAANENQAGAEDSAPEVEKRDDHASESMAAPILPFVFVSTEMPEHSMPGDTPTASESSAGLPQTVPEGCAGASNRVSTSAPANPSATPILRSADLADSAQASAVMPDWQTPAIEAEIRAAAIPQAAAAPTSGATCDAGHPISIMPPADAVVSPAPSAPSPASAARVLETRNPQAQLRGVSTSPATMQQADADLSPEAARAMDSTAVEPDNQVPVTLAVRTEAFAAAVPARTTAIPVFPPALSEESSSEAPAQKSSASEPNSPDGSTAISPPKSEAADAASVSAAFFGLEGVAQSKDAGVRRTPDLPAVRGNAQEIQPAMRRTQTVDQPVAVLTTPQPAADMGQVSSEFAFAADIPKGEHLQENLGQTNAAAKPAGAETAKEAPAERMEPTADSVESAWADTQNAQRMLFHNQSAHTSTSDVPVFAGFRPLPNAASTTSASWEAGFQLPHQAAGTELKSILALLAPKQSAPAQGTDFLAQLIGRIQMQLRDNQNILTIQLKPSSLGRMEIKAETSAAGVLATILTESASVKDYLERNLPLLQQNFQDQGLKIDRISVAVQEGSWPQQSSPGHQESRSSSNQQDDSGFHSKISDHFGEPGEELALDQQTLLALRPHSTFHAIA